MTYKFRVKAACRVARIDRDRFNEAVHAGNYTCAPPVLRGATRVFDEDDLVCLFAYGRMLDWGFAPKLAGNFACKIRDKLNGNPDERGVVIAFDSTDDVNTFRSGDIKHGLRVLSSGDPIIGRFEFDIENIRAIIKREAETEANILGEED